MKKTKVYYGRDIIGRFTCDGRLMTKFEAIRFQIVRTIKRSIAVSAVFVIAGWVAVGGYTYAKYNVAPVTLWAKETVEVPIKEVPPVLKRIAKCESGDMHYKNGQVIFNANSNGTVDRGRYQINSVWDKKATELGLDLSKEKDNESMAMWIYENRGTEDWYSSKSCWNK